MRAPTSRLPTAAFYVGAVAVLSLAGCGGPKYIFTEVEGKVTAGGKPLAGVIVTFYPDSEDRDQLPYARGTTDETGTYRLAGANGEPGALVGKNRVVVNWPLPERRDDRPPPPPPSPVIPIPYTVATLTPIVVEVKEGPRQTIDLPIDLRLRVSVPVQ
jgi:hypothetical protein